MYAVERLGSYITRGVYTVSGPFHPFGGAVDIIVVEQPDGSFKSSPWYVRFGKFQGVLRAREKVVTITVNGNDANFHMYLDQRGEAFFLHEVEGEEGESVSYLSSSSDEMEEGSQKIRSTMKSESCNYEGNNLNSGDRIDASNGDVARSNSHQSRVSRLVFGRRSMKEDGYQGGVDGAGVVRISSLDRAEIAADLVETFMLNESDLEEKLVEISESSKNIDEPSLENVDQDNDVTDVLPEVTCSDSQIADAFEACPGKKLDDKQASDDRNVVLPGFGISQEESGSSRVQSFIYREASESAIMGLNGLKEQYEETLFLTSGEAEEAQFCAETLHVTAEPLPEDTVNQQTEDIELERGRIESCETNPSSSSIHGPDGANLEVPLTISTSYTQMVHVDSVLRSVEVESKRPVSNVSNSVDQTEEEINIGDKITRDELKPSLESAGVSEQLNGEYTTKEAIIPVSESSEEEQFFFSDIDDFELRETQADSNFPGGVDNENLPSFCPEGIKIVNGLLNTNDETYSSPHNYFQENGLGDFENLTENPKLTLSPVCIPKRHNAAEAEVGRLTESLPELWSHIDNLGTEDSRPLSHSLDLNSESMEWKLHGKNESHFTNSDKGNENKSMEDYSNKEDTQHLEDIKDDVGNPAIEISLCKHLLYEGMGAEAAYQAFNAEKLDMEKFTSLGPAVVKNDRLVVRIGGHYFPWDVAAPIVLGLVAFGSENIFELKGMIPVDQVEKSLVGDPSETIVTTGGSWWPFPFRRSRSRKTVQPDLSDTRSSDDLIVSDSIICMDDDKNALKGKASNKMIKAIAPTSEQLASLNLKEGSNAVTFTFSTAMLGKQKVDARIYLWKWSTRIVISDVDGTITKSDVLGQFMPLVGIDWSQTGVAHLFSAIKDNGYQFLYLSARAIAQAYLTRQFLVNLKQDGKGLPDGPVVISPDGLFPSLFREVIRRAPHEFKIACLEEIKALFPSDCNPFYTGFGNRDTDEISYLKVGIPKGKIFIINPKGEVAVNRLVDTRSYTSLHALVHGMFPARTSSEQEDYNSWNFWKLPPPDIDI
ncbi:hypothetical protein P3X46_002259 [Hevea brasiliensis]|uniref:phosphatidate phosphatase n=1 Tax=Hevea brasiliensis TaxID=3981 RepID=A0ABQ9N679_HEVBR|nr:phosphatidate phosphatase PAH2-like [Hevea brasiliensis]KAJ9186715.1 hypothetical protein P3X46_002259 [Hevea brasiliensis]